MIHVESLKKRQVVKVLVDLPKQHLKAGDLLEVVEVKWSPWDALHYAVTKKKSNGNRVEIIHELDAYELLG